VIDSRPRFDATVVIPTHNREVSLLRALEALCTQTAPADSFEVIVVADGCDDGTQAAVASQTTPYRLRLIELDGRGAATARNHGADAADGELLIFFDDDVEPSNQLISEHLRAHRQDSRSLVIGCCPPVIRGTSLIDVELRRWWHDHILSMRRTDHRYTYRDMHAGNFSITRDLYRETGGFDEAFPGCGGEDYEFGARLLARNVDFSFSNTALGLHHEKSDLDRSLRRALQEGRADVLIGQRHPELRRDLPLATSRGANRALRRAQARAFRPRRSPWARLARLRVSLLERLHLRRKAFWYYILLRRYWYFRGVAHELGSGQELDRFLAASPPEQQLEGALLDVDLAAGLQNAIQFIDEQRPPGVRLRFGTIEIGVLSPSAGAEPVRGRQITRCLETSASLISALAVSSAVDPEAALLAWLGREPSDASSAVESPLLEEQAV
jgi:glycosyltransferase involved in cell wall biosynthesis